MPVSNVKTLQHYFRHVVSVFTEKSSSLDLIGSFERPHDLVRDHNRGTTINEWCERRESNPHGGCPLDPKSYFLFLALFS